MKEKVHLIKDIHFGYRDCSRLTNNIPLAGDVVAAKSYARRS